VNLRTDLSVPMLLLLGASQLVDPLAGSLRAQQDDDYDAAAACRALSQQADRGELTLPIVLRVLGGKRESEARTVAAIVRHEWAELPDALFDGLDEDPRAARRFLEELARAPRPQAHAWVLRQSEARHARSYDHRLLALAARAEPLGRDEAALLLESLQHERPGDGFYFACSYLTPKVADGLVGRVHAALMQGVPEPQAEGQPSGPTVASLTPLLDRLSRRGLKSLLGLAMTLPPAVAHKLLRHVHDTRPELVEERLEAALDGRIPLEPQWLAFAPKRIDRPERVQRVLAVLRDADDQDDRDFAFEALLEAGAIDAEVLEVATDGESIPRIRRIIARSANEIPVDYVVRWLGSTPEVSGAMAQALARRPQLEPEIQRTLLAMLDDVEQADRFTPLHLVTALVHGGDATALERVWPLVLGSTAWRDLLDRVGRRTEPFVYERLLASLEQQRGLEVQEDRQERHQQQLDVLRLQLVARGDRRELDALVAHAPSRDATFVRRCRNYAESLTAEQGASLVRAAFASEDPEQAGELLEWAAVAQPQATAASLWSFWNDPPDDDSADRVPAVEDLFEIAMRLLMATDRREDLLAQLRAAIVAGPLDDQLASLPYEALNGMPEPLHASDLRLCCDLLLRVPIADPEAERRQVRRWPDGTFGFPLVRAIANRLRTADEVEAELVFGEVVEELRGSPGCASISRQRLKVFWRALSRQPSLQRALGRVTARLWTHTQADDDVGEGAAIWLQAHDAELRGEHATAERLYRLAGRELLRLPSRRAEVRWLLGDRNPAGGDDPFAALAAAPYRMRLLAARAAGNDRLAAEAAAMVREFAGHDAATRATVDLTTEESGR
jgi:hypothetical protein